jgi:hypothetical protein
VPSWPSTNTLCFFILTTFVSTTGAKDKPAP